MREFKIALFGPRYVGKTSLLAAMYQQLENGSDPTNIQLTPDAKTAKVLEKRLAELKNLSEDFQARLGVQNTEAAAGPESLRSFIFDLGNKGTQPSMRLHFQDYPGGYVISQDSEEQQFVKQLLVESAAVLIVIDAPALMEAKGRWHNYKNTPLEITAWFRKVYQNIQPPRLVILAPVKCESYMQTSKSAELLLQRVKDEYANLLELLGSSELLPNVAVVIAPVQTVGNVFFSRVQNINDKPHFLFTKREHDAEYNPQDSEQPLKYLLRFLLKLHVQSQWGRFNFLRDWFNIDERFKQAVREFAKDCKNTRGFEVVQGKDWLNI